MDGAAAARQRLRASRRAKKQPLGPLGLNAGESTSIVERLAAEASKAAHRQQHSQRSGAEARGSARGSTVFGNAATRRADMRRQLAREAEAEAVSAALGDAAASSTWMTKVQPSRQQGKGRNSASQVLGMYPGRKAPSAAAASRVPSRGSSQLLRRRRRADPFLVLTAALQSAVLAQLPRPCLIAVSQTCRSARVAALSALARSAATAERRLAEQRDHERSASGPASNSLSGMPQDDCCPICLSDVEDAASCVQLQCGHGYHAECIESWLKLHSTCPVCRKDASGDRSGMSIGLLEAARLSTQEVSRAELVELRMGKRPAGVLLAVVGAVLTVLSNGTVDLPKGPLRSLLSSKPDADGWRLWKRGQARLQDVDNFLASLLDLEPLSLAPSTLEKLAPFVECEDLSPLNVDKPIVVQPTTGSSRLPLRMNAPPPHAHVAATLCRWFRAIYACATTPTVRDQLLQKEHYRAAQAHRRWNELLDGWASSSSPLGPKNAIDEDNARLNIEVDHDAGYAQFVPGSPHVQGPSLGTTRAPVEIQHHRLEPADVGESCGQSDPSLLAAVATTQAAPQLQQQMEQLEGGTSAAEMRRQRLARFDRPTEPQPHTQTQTADSATSSDSVAAGISDLCVSDTGGVCGWSD